MVGADGKPYQPRNQNGGSQRPSGFPAVKAVTQNADDDDEPDIVGYVGSVNRTAPAQPAHLNW